MSDRPPRPPGYEEWVEVYTTPPTWAGLVLMDNEWKQASNISIATTHVAVRDKDRHYILARIDCITAYLVPPTPRTVPTRPGVWVASWSRYTPRPIHVYRCDGRLWAAPLGGCGSFDVTHQDWTWHHEIPLDDTTRRLLGLEKE